MVLGLVGSFGARMQESQRRPVAGSRSNLASSVSVFKGRSTKKAFMERSRIIGYYDPNIAI